MRRNKSKSKQASKRKRGHGTQLTSRATQVRRFFQRQVQVEKRDTRSNYNLRKTASRRSAQAESEGNPQEPSGDSDLQEEDPEEPPVGEEPFESDEGGGPAPEEVGHGEFAEVESPLRTPVPPPEGASSSSSSSRSKVSRTPASRGRRSRRRGGKRTQQASPSRADSSEGSALERLALALEKDRIERRANGMDELQIKMLANYQSFDSARHDI